MRSCLIQVLPTFRGCSTNIGVFLFVFRIRRGCIPDRKADPFRGRRLSRCLRRRASTPPQVLGGVAEAEGQPSHALQRQVRPSIIAPRSLFSFACDQSPHGSVAEWRAKIRRGVTRMKRCGWTRWSCNPVWERELAWELQPAHTMCSRDGSIETTTATIVSPAPCTNKVSRGDRSFRGNRAWSATILSPSALLTDAVAGMRAAWPVQFQNIRAKQRPSQPPVVASCALASSSPSPYE